MRLGGARSASLDVSHFQATATPAVTRLGGKPPARARAWRARRRPVGCQQPPCTVPRARRAGVGHCGLMRKRRSAWNRSAPKRRRLQEGGPVRAAERSVRSPPYSKRRGGADHGIRPPRFGPVQPGSRSRFSPGRLPRRSIARRRRSSQGVCSLSWCRPRLREPRDWDGRWQLRGARRRWR